MSNGPIVNYSSLHSADRQKLKEVPGKAPKWGMACPSKECSASFHDLRTPGTYFNCLERADLSISGAAMLKNVFQERQRWYHSTIYSRRLDTIPQDLCRFLRGNPDYLRKGLLYVEFLKARAAKNFTMDMVPASFQERWRAEEFCRQWDRLTNSERELSHEAIEAVDRFLGERNIQILLKQEPAPTKESTLKEFQSGEPLTLEEMLKVRRLADSMTIYPKPKRRWWNPFVAIPQEPVYDELYYKINAIIDELHPRSAEIYRLFEAVAGDSSLDTPEVRARIEEEFKRVRAIEATFYAKENDPMAVVEAALESIAGDLVESPAQEAPDIASLNPPEADKAVKLSLLSNPKSQIN